ncbi:MAG: hypothetical protein ACR2PF_03270 [Rhizobiaceae bacterium]
MSEEVLDTDEFFKRVQSDVRKLVNGYSNEGWPSGFTATALLMTAGVITADRHENREAFEQAMITAAKGMIAPETLHYAWQSGCEMQAFNGDVVSHEENRPH